MSELIHSDFETIEWGDNEYRISTRVEYGVDSSTYTCKAKLYKSHNGRIRDARRDRLHTKSLRTSEKNDIEERLVECVESCKDRLDELEDAIDVSVDVTIADSDGEQ